MQKAKLRWLKNRFRPSYQAVKTLYFRCLTSFNPRNPDTYSDLGQLLIRQEKYQSAIATLKQAIELNSKSDLLNQSLNEAVALQKRSQAINSLKLAVKQNPQDLQSRYELGRTLFKHQRWQEAAQVLEENIELMPHGVHSYHLLAQTIDRLSDLSNSKKNTAETIDKFKSLNSKLVAVKKPHFQFKHNNQTQKPPQFLIIGQHKCGTTSLYSYINQHPHVLPALKKEIDFWTKNFELGYDWYLAHFPEIDPQQKFIAGEASPSYLNAPEIVEKILAKFPDLKIIILLRNPVTRTISHYNMNYRDIRETRPIEAAILSEISALKNGYLANCESNHTTNKYLKGSRYIELVSKWVSALTKEQILILKSEDLFTNPEKSVNRVFNFLDLEPFQLDKYRKINSADYADISESNKKIMQDYFRPYNQQLEEFLNYKFNWYE